MLEIEGVDHISDEMRAVLEDLWPDDETDAGNFSSASSALASRRSAVSKPSVS